MSILIASVRARSGKSLISSNKDRIEVTHGFVVTKTTEF